MSDRTDTPTGISITDCDVCGWRHPVTRSHCEICGMASLFKHDFCAEPDTTTPKETIDE